MIKFEFNNAFQEADTLLANFDVKIDATLPQIAEAVRQSVEENLNNPRSFDGSQLAPLKLSILKRKKRLGQPSKIFHATGKLIKSVAKRKLNKDTYEIFIKGDRADVMFYLQRGKKPLAGQRKGFGISKQTAENVNYILKQVKLAA